MTKEVVKYTEEDKLIAVEAFFLTRSSKKASDLIKKEHGKDIPSSTIRRWKQNKKDWDSNMQCVKNHYGERFEGKLTRIIEISSDKLLHALEHGDKKLSPTGDIIHVPVPASELVRIQKQAHDQLVTLQGPLSSKDKDKSPMGLTQMGEYFEKAGMEAKIKEVTIINESKERVINEQD